MNNEYTIVGGGVAGLCACMRLLEKGILPLVIEAGHYPSQKVCGEFFFPRGSQVLKNWGIEPVEITDAYFHIDKELFHYPFKEPCGSLSHLKVDPLLVKKNEGATFLTGTEVKRIVPGNPFTLELSSKDTMTTSNLILATGRLPFNDPPQFVYKGFQAHIKGDFRKNALEMFLFEEGYLGISPIEDGYHNVAGLVKMNLFQQWGSIPSLFAHWKEKNHALGSFPPIIWKETSIPEFGRKKVPNWPHAYFVGDAVRTIPPITGNGLTLGMESAIQAADYSFHRNYLGYHKSQAGFSYPIFWGKALQALAMKPKIAKLLVKWGKQPLMNMFYQLTR